MYSNLYVNKLNESALEALGQNEVYQAQILFRQNAKNNPCFMTLNNLGVFHIFEGLIKPDNSGHGATKLGTSYLRKAELYQKSNLTLLAFGRVFFESEDYKDASEYFRQACDLKPDYASLYNCGASFYMDGLYGDAAKWFFKALKICCQSDYIDTYMAYTFSLLYSDKKEYLEASHKILEDNTVGLEWEKFILAYFCDDLFIAESQISKMFSNNCLFFKEMTMIFDCLFRLKKDSEAEEYLKLQIESLKGFEYNIEPEIRRTRKAFYKPDYRAKVIADFRYPVPLIGQCCYYGCSKHNPL